MTRTDRSASRITGRLVPAVGVVVVVAVVVLWLVRPIGLVHGPIMLVVRHPALVALPLLAALVAFVVHTVLRSPKRRWEARHHRAADQEDVEALEARAAAGDVRARVLLHRREAGTAHRRGGGLRSWHSPATSALVAGGVALFVAAALTDAWTQAAIARHVGYRQLAASELTGGSVRIKPFEVASNQLDSNFSSSTEDVSNVHVVRLDGRLAYTGFRDPKGFWRSFRKRTTGIISAGGDTSRAAVAVHATGYDADGGFKVGPGMRVTDNVTWKTYKEDFFSDVQEMVALPTPDGPVVMASLVKYDLGLLTSRPYFAGVVLIRPDGQIARLSAAQAADNELVARSGRLFPEKLARRIADAFKYRKGVWNRLFTHEDGYEVADTDSNRQPYLQDFKTLSTQWTSTLRPRGRGAATGLVIVTDAVSGRTRVYRVPDSKTLIGNTKALDIVKGERLGVNFAGAFRAVEPRQVFPGGRLMFLVSVVPKSAQRVTLNVLVDAESQQVAKVFPATDAGDRALISFLDDGKVDGYDFDGEEAGDGTDPSPASTPSGGPLPQGTGAAATIDRLLEQNRRDQRDTRGRLDDLRRQEADLERLRDGDRQP